MVIVVAAAIVVRLILLEVLIFQSALNPHRVPEFS